MPNGNFPLLAKWWDDTGQHRYGLAAYLRMRSQAGDTLSVLADDLEHRLDGAVSYDRATIHRWLAKLDDGNTPS